MQLGVSVLAWTPDAEKYQNDNIHPCVRYIPGGLGGHDWWMVTTPYPNYTVSAENPILYYGDSVNGEPPLSWQGGIVIEDTPAYGYNSDGNLFYDGTGLWIFWRENNTPSCEANNTTRGVFGVYTTDGVNFTQKKFFAPLGFSESGKTGDCEMCPCVVKIDNAIHLFGTYYEFTPVQQCYGLCSWNIQDNNLVDNVFVLDKKIGILTPIGFDFWHFDMFEYDGKFYCVATAEDAKKIMLGVSPDGFNYKFWGTPLISTEITGGDYFYKPTALVLNGVLYLWHPNRINGKNQIYMTSKNMEDVLRELNKNISLLY